MEVAVFLFLFGKPTGEYRGSQLCAVQFYSKRQKDEGRGQKVDYCYVVVSAAKSVLTFMPTVLTSLFVGEKL